MKAEQQLIAKGFGRYYDNMKRRETYYCSYQLKVCDEKGKKYFVDVSLYDYNKSEFKSHLPKNMLEDYQMEFTAQLTTKQGETFNVDYLEKDVDKALEFYENMFQKLDLEYYEEI